VGEEGRVVSPDTIAVGVFTLLGVVVGLFGERWVRRLGRVWCEVDAWYVHNQWSQPGPVNLPSRKPVTRTLSVALGDVHSGSMTRPDPDKLRAVQGADRAEFVASIIDAKDKKKKLTPTW
jgi:hypothetical protein